jgi:putative endonuclease
LRLKGYRVRDRNWRGPSGELDLVVERHGEIVFVEVKTRSGQGFGGALGAVDRAKRSAIDRTASAYLGRHGLWNRPCRFDIVTVERAPRLPWVRIRHFVDAFGEDRGRLMP